MSKYRKDTDKGKKKAFSNRQRKRGREYCRRMEEKEGAASPVVIVQAASHTAPLETPEYLAQLPYREYMCTKHWLLLSNKVKHKARNRCKLCGSENRPQVHHNSYANRGYIKKEIKDLVCLCRNCHMNEHNLV